MKNPKSKSVERRMVCYGSIYYPEETFTSYLFEAFQDEIVEKVIDCLMFYS